MRNLWFNSSVSVMLHDEGCALKLADLSLHNVERYVFDRLPGREDKIVPTDRGTRPFYVKRLSAVVMAFCDEAPTDSQVARADAGIGDA